jgi:hypothetical protein
MTMPEDPKQQIDHAIGAAWDAAERCQTLVEANNGSSALVWAATAQAWAQIATSIGARLP